MSGRGDLMRAWGMAQSMKMGVGVYIYPTANGELTVHAATFGGPALFCEPDADGVPTPTLVWRG